MRGVDQSHYSKDYYLKHCTHYEEFAESSGLELGERFELITNYLPIQKGMTVLDVGSGRGELVFWAASQGADVIGVDYADAAVELSNEALSSHPPKIQDRVQFVQADVSGLPLASNSVDLVICVEVIEHLFDEQLEALFESLGRILKPGGILVAHTAPNRWFNDYGYPYYSHIVSTGLVTFWNTLTDSNYPHSYHPSELRDEVNEIVHVNEPTYFSLRRLFGQHNFDYSIRSTNMTIKKPLLGLKDAVYNALVYLEPLSHFFPFNIFLGNDFLVVAKKPV